MMCAATAGRRGRRVLLVEHYHKLGEKIRISGGGRCNFTNVGAGPANYLSQNPDFCRSALARYTPRDFVDLVERHGIAYHEKKAGQLFCDGASTQVIDMLRAECDAGGVEWWMPCAVDSVARDGTLFRVATPRGVASAPALVVATGGLTVPKIGATSFAYRIAGQFGLRVVPPRPALVPLAFAPEALARYGDLAGVSIDAEVACGAARFRESLLFTHRGLSGPAILQISSFWDGRSPLAIDLLPGLDAARVARRAPAVARAARYAAGRKAAAPLRAAMVRRARRGAAAARSRRRGAHRAGRESRRLAGAAVRHARLRQGRSDRGRRRYARPVVEDDGGAARARPPLHRRSRRRHRLAGRLQLPVGVVVGARGRPVRRQLSGRLR